MVLADQPALVSVDGEVAGVTPVTRRMSPGIYRVSVKFRGQARRRTRWIRVTRTRPVKLRFSASTATAAADDRDGAGAMEDAARL